MINPDLRCRCIEWSETEGCCLERAPLDPGHVAVQSSNVQSVGYTEATLTLEVRYKSGGLYQYVGVTRDKYDALVNAESIGKHLHAQVKGKYQCIKIEEKT